MKVCDMMANADNREYVFSKKYTLTEKALNEICESVKKKYGLEVSKVEENPNGYVFISKHGYTIGDVSYDFHTGLYRNFNFHMGVVEKETEATEREMREFRYKRFKLQRRKTVWRLTAAAILVLASIGAIKTLPGALHKNTSEPEIHLNSVASADDLVLFSWANYAMGKIADSVSDSPYDAAQEQKDNLYSDFSNMMINYYNYVDQIESGLPYDITANLIDKYHDEFRDAASQYNDAILNSMFANVSFSSTPYADATVLDETGGTFNKGEALGEVVDSGNNVVLVDYKDAPYKIYVQASDVKDGDYSIDNLPEGSVVYNGEVYVTDSILYSDGVDSPAKK